MRICNARFQESRDVASAGDSFNKCNCHRARDIQTEFFRIGFYVMLIDKFSGKPGVYEKHTVLITGILLLHIVDVLHEDFCDHLDYFSVFFDFVNGACNAYDAGYFIIDFQRKINTDFASWILIFVFDDKRIKIFGYNFMRRYMIFIHA